MIYLVCGVPGSGKSWAIEQVMDKFNYISHDAFSHQKICDLAAYFLVKYPSTPVLIDCPFAERALRSKLERVGEVLPLFIVEGADVVRERYLSREGREPDANILTRASTIMNKVREWGAFYGTSEAIANYLKRVVKC